MISTDNIAEIRRIRWENPVLTWGFVPTMGYLHAGHLSLVKRALEENDQCVVSIYVNPLQFGVNEDLEQYPKNLERDLLLLEQAGVSAVFIPDNRIMYEEGFSLQVLENDLSKKLEGASRPALFQGVTTVVAKLFNITQPTSAYFGQKDAQQALIIQKMVKELNFNLKVVVCPIIREKDGLAMSSRNSYLLPEERAGAAIIFQSLQAAQTMIENGERNTKSVIRRMKEIIEQQPLAVIDYISINNADTLDTSLTITGKILILLAVYFGKTRLIDNLLLEL